CEVRVTEGIAGTIAAGALAVPHAEYAIELALAAQFGLLGSPQRGSGELFVDARLKLDVGRHKPACGADELLVETAERRSAIAGDETRGIQACATIEFLLHQASADQRLIPRHEYVRLGKVVFILEADRSKRHGLPCHAAYWGRQSHSYRLAPHDAKCRVQDKGYTAGTSGQFRS